MTPNGRPRIADYKRDRKVVISQPQGGYRFTSDSLALARFVKIGSSESLLDLGTGVGVVPLLICQSCTFRFAVGIELQQELADFAARNVRESALSDKIFILQGDLRTVSPENVYLFTGIPCERGFDVVSANPPYLTEGSGRVSPNLQKALARHEIQLTFSDLVSACQRFLKSTGRLYFVHRSKRENELMKSLESHGFVIVDKQYANKGSDRTTLLVEARMSGASAPKREPRVH
jgi:tRNA1Val (adenine37-N6)-methyltransferase